MIDAHVHLRDFEQREKDTIEHALAVCKKAGIQRVFDMPNTRPAITTRSVALDRLSLASVWSKKYKVSYCLYMGLTNDKEQIKEAVDTYNELFPLVVGLKMFLGHSTGNMGIVKYEDQEEVLRELTRLGYEGVLVLHCEKEEFINSALFNKDDVSTHSKARPVEAEYESVKDIITISKKVGFKGVLHLAHLSTRKAIELALREKESVKLTINVTPHHALLTFDDAKRNKYLKVNPPLRSKDDRDYILESIISGRVDSIESDHAPHTIEDKEMGASGLPGFYSMLKLLALLREKGVSEDRLKLIFGKNQIKEFNLDDEEILLPKDVEVRMKKIEKEYPFLPL